MKEFLEAGTVAQASKYSASSTCSRCMPTVKFSDLPTHPVSPSLPGKCAKSQNHCTLPIGWCNG